MVSTPWIWSRRLDLAAFGGSAALALAVAGLSPWLSPTGAVPPWLWVVFVLGIDVAHVWSTLFRTYLDGDELRKRRLLYLGLPVVCYLGGVAVHLLGTAVFWRALAYLAAFHFIRQQIGWVAIYRARAGERAVLDRRLDAAVIYLATGWPLLYWHTHLPRAFHWFMPGDFVALPALRWLTGPMLALYLLVGLGYVARSLWHARSGHPVNWGKHLVVATTAIIWSVGIVLVDQDLTFTVTNVTIHGLPYFFLLWAYAKARAPERPASLLARIVRFGVPAFVTLLLVIAFAEEMLWDRLVWHQRPYLFGGVLRDEPLLSDLAAALVVPLLSLPQLVHYALDGVLWRSKDAGPAQARALGFLPPQRLATGTRA
ncbi:MAG: hypothetical protein KC731_25135 [Myxococcales bacterium]|nr:hypothetical protein [Myxococcales bacterium]